jgi:hypothetical protein
MPANSKWDLIQGLKGSNVTGIPAAAYEDVCTFMIIKRYSNPITGLDRP